MSFSFLDLRHGTVLRTLIPKIAEGIFTVICKFNATNEYVLYYHSGRKTLRVFRARDGVMIANYRVPSDLSSLESTTDGYSVVLGKNFFLSWNGFAHAYSQNC